jgi:two-component system response regulator HydG
MLIDHFLDQFSKEHGKADVRLTKRALNRLMQFPWPGNVRQLRNVIENLVLFSDGHEVDVDDLSPEILSDSTKEITFQVGTPLDHVERKLIERTLLHANSNRTHAAELLGISRRTLLRKIKELSLEG